MKKTKKIIVSLSPQSRSSLAVHYNISNELFVEKLITMLSKWNIEYLFDTSFASQIALIESLTQFLDRKKNSLHLPMLTSNCPGFVTYAETSHDYLLPYISSIKSPQQVFYYLFILFLLYFFISLFITIYFEYTQSIFCSLFLSFFPTIKNYYSFFEGDGSFD